MARVMLKTREVGEVFPEELNARTGWDFDRGQNAERPLFVIHPSKRDGDSLELARDGIQELVDRLHSKMRAVIIAPPGGSVYLREGTSVDSVRDSARTYDWITSGDLTGVTRLALAGGNLELCLADALNEVKYCATTDSSKEPIQVDLPLNAIYSRHGLTAAQLFNEISRARGELFAAVSILSSHEPRIDYGGGMAHGDISVVSPKEAVAYEFQINGKSIGIISPKDTLQAPRTIKINLELADTDPIQASDDLDRLCADKINHTVGLLEQYSVMQK